MHSNFVFTLVCCSIFFIAKGDEKPEEWRLKLEEANGTCSRKFKVETLQETCKDFPPCIEGEKGVAGPKGDNGDKGDKGPQGPIGECPPLGTEKNPDTSCNTALDDTWIFRPKPFQVSCKNKSEICIDIPKTNLSTEDLNKRSTIVTKEDWLWTAIKKTDFKDFYGYEKSQISHLVSISDDVTMELMVHCYNFELKDNIQILLLDSTHVGQNPTPDSPVTYTVRHNGCKNLGANEWGSAIISLKTWSTAIKNFYVKPEETTAEQRIYIQLNKLCFNFFLKHD
ncbi:uncharacterized protein LOC121740401 [Aricia agestis]|uniref:uncharacterized protein LOC121740401 n=1 Tax=Aricia agestis TaxID=91739 RepID=UPI001C2043A1|nr:uncharacterized protein LOC121740401 [Aricia agestis]